MEWGESLEGLRGGDKGGVNGGGAGGGGASAGGSGPGRTGVAAGSLRRGRAQTSPQPGETPPAPSSHRAQVGASPSPARARRPAAAGPLLGAPLGDSAPLRRCLGLPRRAARPRPSPALPPSPRGPRLWVRVPLSTGLGWVPVCGPLSLLGVPLPLHLWVSLCLFLSLCFSVCLWLRLSVSIALLPASLCLYPSVSPTLSPRGFLCLPTPWFSPVSVHLFCPFPSCVSVSFSVFPETPRSSHSKF